MPYPHLVVHHSLQGSLVCPLPYSWLPSSSPRPRESQKVCSWMWPRPIICTCGSGGPEGGKSGCSGPDSTVGRSFTTQDTIGLWKGKMLAYGTSYGKGHWNWECRRCESALNSKAISTLWGWNALGDPWERQLSAKVLQSLLKSYLSDALERLPVSLLPAIDLSGAVSLTGRLPGRSSGTCLWGTWVGLERIPMQSEA